VYDKFDSVLVLALPLVKGESRRGGGFLN
jgi:hypothetical protein